MHDHLNLSTETLKHNTDLSLCFFCFFFCFNYFFLSFILTLSTLALSFSLSPINQSWHRKTFIGASIYLTYRVTSKRISMSFISFTPVSVFLTPEIPPIPLFLPLNFNSMLYKHFLPIAPNLYVYALNFIHTYIYSYVYLISSP